MVLFPSSVDRQLARFCRDGDPQALGAVFDRTASELLRIACYLCGNRADAEDLVQRTFLAAIERRSSFGPERRAMPWLCGILANHARQLQRERSRQPARPDGDEPSSDPAVEAAQRELDERLAQLRGALAAPYADVLRLHLEQGLTAKEIAGRLARPAGTVRTQLMRALAQLKQRLPDGFVAGSALALLAQPSSAQAPILLAMRRQLVQAAGTSAAPVATGAVIAVTGGWLVGKKIAVLAPLLLCVVLWQLLAQVAPPTPPSALTPTSAPVAAAAPLPTALPANEPADTVHRVAAAALAPVDASPGSGYATLVVRAVHGNAPVSHLGVFADRGRSVARRDAVTDDVGVAILEHLAPGTWSVDSTFGARGRPLRHPRLSVTVAAGERHELVLDLTEVATCHGLVVDAQGRPVADARIWVAVESDDTHGHELGRSDADGRFVVPIVGVHFLGARKSGFAPSRVTMAVRNDASSPLRLCLQHEGGAVAGRVQDERGQPIAFARVLVGGERQQVVNTELRPVLDQVARGIEVATAVDGTFTIDGLAIGVHEVQAWASAHGPVRASIDVPAAGSGTCVLTLPRAAGLRGTVRDASGSALAEVEVWLGDEHTFVHATATTGADGAFELGDLPAGPQQVEARRGGSLLRSTVTLVAGEVVAWDPVLGADLALHGHVVDERGMPLPGHVVAAWRDGTVRDATTTAADGSFHFAAVGSGPLVVEVSVDFQSLLERKNVQPGDGDLRLVLPDSQRPNAYFVGRVLDDAGRPVAATLVPWHPDSKRAKHHQCDPQTGAYRIGPLLPGTYTIDLQAPQLGRAVLHPPELTANATLELGDFVLPTPGGIDLAVTMLGRPALGGSVYFRRPDRTWAETATIENGAVHADALPSGTVTFHAEYQGLQAAGEVTIVAGARTTAAIELQRTMRATVTLVDPRHADGAQGDAVLTAKRPDGTFAGLFSLADRPGARQFLVDLPVGEYTLHVATKDGREAAGRVDLRGGEAAAVVTMPL